MFKLRRSLDKLNISPKLSLHLYDTLIHPITMYASEVWGAFVKSKNQAFRVECDKYELFDNHCFEKLELKYCKAILGVHRKSSNAAVRGEVGRHPTLIRILKQGLKNWFRVTSYKNKESVLYDTYLCNIELQNAKKNCWWANLKLFFTQTLGLSSLLENHGCKNNPKYKIATTVNNMEKIYEFQWRNQISRTTSRNKTAGNKLRTYYTFKKEFQFEKYLELQGNFALRRNITKIRISSHRLEIEAGRYSSKKTNRTRVEANQRLCRNCDLKEVEDEEHAITSCPKYKNDREMMFNFLAETFPHFTNLNNHEKFLFIIRCHDYEVTDSLSKMLRATEEKRGSL